MAVPLVHVRHKKTGEKTFLPESALRFFPDYVKTPSQKSRDQVPDGTAFPQTVGDQPATADDQSADTTTKTPSASDKRS